MNTRYTLQYIYTYYTIIRRCRGWTTGELYYLWICISICSKTSYSNNLLRSINFWIKCISFIKILNIEYNLNVSNVFTVCLDSLSHTTTQTLLILVLTRISQFWNQYWFENYGRCVFLTILRPKQLNECLESLLWRRIILRHFISNSGSLDIPLSLFVTSFPTVFRWPLTQEVGRVMVTFLPQRRHVGGGKGGVAPRFPWKCGALMCDRTSPVPSGSARTSGPSPPPQWLGKGPRESLVIDYYPSHPAPWSIDHHWLNTSARATGYSTVNEHVLGWRRC